MGDVGFPISQGSPYRIFLDQAIKDITEDGQLERMQKIWTKPKPDCSPILLTGKVLTLQKLAGPFLVFILGLVLTLFVMMAEMVLEIKHPKKGTSNISAKSNKIEEIFDPNLNARITNSPLPTSTFTQVL